MITMSGRRIGPGERVFIIAEAGVNHNGDVDCARRLIEAAADAEADAVKFQTFRADHVATSHAPKAPYQARATGTCESQQQMLRRLELPRAAYGALAKDCRRRGLVFLSTPFEEDSADFLEALGIAAFKMPSGELTNLPLLAHVARKGKPMLVSTGMASLEEVEAAVRTLEQAGNRQLVLLHCVSCYPADPSEANLRAMQTLADAFHVPVGFSDHTMGCEVALAAVALGACVIEKHLTLDRRQPGPDHRSSLEPGEFAALVQGIRRVESSLGHGRKEPAPREEETARVARKSLVAARAIRAGSQLTEESIEIKRPGTGLPPSMRGRLIGREAVTDIPEGAVLTLEMVR